MPLSQYINATYSSEIENQLIRELNECSANEISLLEIKFEELFDCGLNELPTWVVKTIQGVALHDGDVAYILGKRYADLYNLAIEEDNEKEEMLFAEKKNLWYIKAFELDSTFIDIGCDAWPEIQGSISFCSLFDLEAEVDYFNPFFCTPLLRKADSECLNSWGCRYAEWGITGNNKEYIDNACFLFNLSNSKESKLSLYHIYANGLGLKKNKIVAFSYLRKLPHNIPFYAFKSNVSTGIKIKRPTKNVRIKYDIICTIVSLLETFVKISIALLVISVIVFLIYRFIF